MLRLTGAQGDEGLGDTAPEALQGIRFSCRYSLCVLLSERLEGQNNGERLYYCTTVECLGD